MGSPTVEAARLFDPILVRLRADLAAEFQTPHVQLDRMAYEDRPFSHMLRVRAHGGPAEHEGTFFVKIFKSKPLDGGVDRMRSRVAHDFEATRRIADAMAGHHDVGVVRPVACYLDHLAIVTKQAPGDTLRVYLETSARWFPSATRRREMEQTLSRIGRWLRAFQSVDQLTATVALADLREYVDVRLTRLVEHGVWTTLQRQNVLDHLTSLGTRVSTDELGQVLVHADLAPGNILVSEGRVIVIDLAMVQRGTALHDISRLYLQLDVLRAKPQFRPATVERLQAALLRGFDGALTAERPLFRYLLMLHRINHLSTLSLSREPFPGALFSRRVRRIHRTWIEKELRKGAAHGAGI